MKYCSSKYTKTIENVLDEMECIGLIDTNTKDGTFNMVNNVRCWMGEKEFYEFLKQMCLERAVEQDWHFEHLMLHFKEEEE